MAVEVIKTYAKITVKSAVAVLLLFFFLSMFFTAESHADACFLTSLITISFLVLRWKVDTRPHEIASVVAVTSLIASVLTFYLGGLVWPLIINGLAVGLIVLIASFVAKTLSEDRRTMIMLFLGEGLFVFLVIYYT